MGADERVFRPQLDACPQLVVPNWIDPLPRESLSGYARRLAADVDPGCPCVIGGASFGGFVALEAARHLDAKACILIGSLRSPREFPPAMRALRSARCAAGAVPFRAMSRATGVATKAFGWLSRPATRQFLEQFANADGAFLRWASWAVLGWEPTDPPLNIPIHHIHGDRDRVLPIRYTHPDQIVHGGGHVLSISHADAVNRFITTRLRTISA
jgi:pimeloyl-ACP methyl ester carboxylesterase